MKTNILTSLSRYLFCCYFVCAEFEDEETQLLWEQLCRFKDDPASSELAFSASLTNQQRKQIHYLSERLDLIHYSQGEGENRYIIVSKRIGKPGSPSQLRTADAVSPRAPSASNGEPVMPVFTGAGTLGSNWRARTQAEKEQKGLLPRTAKVEPVRQPRLPEANQKGFADEYRICRRAPAPTAASAAVRVPVLNPTAPVFVPGSHSPVLARAATAGSLAPTLASPDKSSSVPIVASPGSQ